MKSMPNRFLFLSALLAVGVFTALPQVTHAQVAQGTVRIEQVSPDKVKHGTWTLLTASGTVRSSEDEGVTPNDYSYALSEFGQMVFSVKPPAGMSTKISIYRGGTLQKSVDAQQYEFALYPNDNYRLLVQYAFTKLGELGLNSDPTGLVFRIKGPRNMSGKTPRTFTNLPAGRYTIYFTRVGDKCVSPAPHTVAVTPEKRITKLITIPCNIQVEEELVRNAPTRRALREAVEAREARPRGERK